MFPALIMSRMNMHVLSMLKAHFKCPQTPELEDLADVKNRKFQNFKTLFLRFLSRAESCKLLHSARNSAVEGKNASRYVQFRLSALCVKRFKKI